MVFEKNIAYIPYVLSKGNIFWLLLTNRDVKFKKEEEKISQRTYHSTK